LRSVLSSSSSTCGMTNSKGVGFNCAIGGSDPNAFDMLS
jgi:hypothetical protein